MRVCPPTPSHSVKTLLPLGPRAGRCSVSIILMKCIQIANWHTLQGRVSPQKLGALCRLRCMEAFPPFSQKPCACTDIQYVFHWNERRPPVYCWCDSARHALCVPAGHRSGEVRKRKLASPFGRGPNWLGAADRMLTEHTQQTGSLPLPSISSRGFS